MNSIFRQIFSFLQTATSQVPLVIKNPPANAGDIRDPWVGKTHGGGQDTPLHYSCLKNPMDRGIWQAAVLRITKSWTLLKQLSMHAKSIAAGHPLNIGGTH